MQPFVALQAGDTGVRSVQSVNFALANGGLLGIVLVVPIWQDWMVEECRRTTSSTLESFGSPSEKEAIRQRAGVAQRIYDGAFISFIAHTTAGSVASAQIVGLLETVWR